MRPLFSYRTGVRPLERLGGIGACSADYELFTTNQELYDKLYDRGGHLLEDAEKAYMGHHYYNNPPKSTLKELREQLNFRLLRKKRLVELKAPEAIIQYEDSHIVKLYGYINNKNYGSLSDPAYKQYREAYSKKEKDWHNSKEKETILHEIFSYNENAAQAYRANS